MKPLISMHNVSKSFGHGPVLDGANFSLEKGQVLGLLGRNGAGKSTLMKLALGLIRPQFGEITTLGNNPEDFDAATKNCIGYVPQELIGFDGMRIDALFDFMSQHYTHWDKHYCAQLCSTFDVTLSRRIGKLSGGQKQIVGIILALAHKPELLVLDEPASALDPINRRQFLAEIIDLAVDQESTVLFSTHITQDIERIASHVSILASGQIQLNEELESLKDSLYVLPAATEVPITAKILTTTHTHQWVVSQATIGNAQKSTLEDLFIAMNKIKVAE